jgi:quercetin dioxygenase-like cupin family protein
MVEEQVLVPLGRTLVAGSATGNQLALLEIHGSAGRGVVRHMHEHEDEVVYVLEGELTFYIGEAVQRAPAQSCLVLPRGIEHSYVIESARARLLVALTPAGLEGFLEDMKRTDRRDVERLITLAARYGITITGPAPKIPIATAANDAMDYRRGRWNPRS